VPWYVLCASLARGGEASEEERARVLAVVDAEEEEVLRRDLQRRPEHASHLVAVLRPEEAESAHTGRPRLVDEVREHQASVVIFNRAAQASEDIVAQAASAHESGVRVRTLSLFYEQWLGKLPLHDLERVGLMFDIGEVHRARYGRAKRALDLALGVVGVLVLVVVVPFVFLANLVGNRGPLFYRQLRVGKNGTEFEILKFRTMRPSASQLVDEWTVEDDDRITPVGRVLRKAHLDELPQMINIVRGELAVVGPRPEQVGYVVELTEKIPFYDLRHLVRPGLTGWAQVKYGYAADEADAIEKLQYDFYYLRHQSVSLDLRIIGRTLRSVLQREGR
jgi:lipopolysaccharide/colanic/teichoic acid biosynthesis glycosyltransferase